MANSPTHTTVGVRITKALKTKLDKEAATQHRTVSNLVALMLFEKFGDDAPRPNGADHKRQRATA